MLTDQARMFYRRVIEKVKERIGGELTFKRIFEYLTQRSEVPSSRGRSSMVYDVIGDELGIHSGTMENIVRTILAVDESGMVDVENCNIRIMEPDYREVFAPGHVVVHLVDATPIVQRIVVYRVLERIYEFMGPEHLKDKDRIAVILIDEAHLFFPQARSEDEKSMIEAHLTRLTRLGRGRGIAVVFATHMPSDLNDAVLQLTNTKIILRSDEKVLETLGVPSSERRFLTTAATGLAFINSFAYKYPIYVKVRMTAYHVS
jgi:DNA helicase HerA-like ATPase